MAAPWALKEGVQVDTLVEAWIPGRNWNLTLTLTLIGGLDPREKLEAVFRRTGLTLTLTLTLTLIEQGLPGGARASEPCSAEGFMRLAVRHYQIAAAYDEAP